MNNLTHIFPFENMIIEKKSIFRFTVLYGKFDPLSIFRKFERFERLGWQHCMHSCHDKQTLS